MRVSLLEPGAFEKYPFPRQLKVGSRVMRLAQAETEGKIIDGYFDGERVGLYIWYVVKKDNGETYEARHVELTPAPQGRGHNN